MPQPCKHSICEHYLQQDKIALEQEALGTLDIYDTE